MPTVLEGLGNFLRARRKTHNAPELLDRWSPSMETQMNVAAGNGEPVADKRNTWSDGIDSWHSIRVPKHADSEPEFQDYQLRFVLDLHAEGIGMTGWDWQARVSRHLGFDFDSITGHAAGIGVTDEQLEAVKAAACKLPWVQVHRSTGGKGLHLYVFFDAAGVPCENHTVHAALGRAVLGMMSSEVGFDFASQVDVCGGNMWVWHRKATPENGGLRCLKAAERMLSASDVPANWRDNIEVVKGNRKKPKLVGVPDAEEDEFDRLASSRRKVPLDVRHKEIIDALKETGYSVVWVSDHHCLQTKTTALKQIMGELKIEGVFDTLSQGRNKHTPNCFMFPMAKGAWKVVRFGTGVNEAETWTRDKEGWTTCYYNRPPDLATASKALGGAEMDTGGYQFDTALEAAKVVEALGEQVKLPTKLEERQTHLKRTKDGRLAMFVKKVGDEGRPTGGWADKKGGWWTKVFLAKTETEDTDSNVDQYDSVLRQLVTPAKEDAGWLLKTENGQWHHFATDKVKYLLHHNFNKMDEEAKSILGGAINRLWTLVNLPFQPEYPGNRQWNLDAAQFVYQPAKLDDEEVPHHPHWDKIFDHCGQDLTATIQTLEWAKQAGIRNGADYLRAWVACVFRDPFQQLPYLFFYGSQNCGKSIFHEALSLLITRGYVSADRALTNQNDFCGELANALICYVEEKDISNSPGAYNKIKDWVTGLTIAIRKMRTDTYSQPNTTHWIQCANSPDACPIFPGDTRITMAYVADLKEDEEIPKPQLLAALKQEAPHFMRTLMELQLPPAAGRLRLLVLQTENKKRISEKAIQTELSESADCVDRRNTLSELENFVKTNCQFGPQHWIPKDEIFRAANAWFLANNRPRFDERNYGQFCKDLQALFEKEQVVDQKRTINSKRIAGFKNIALRSNVSPIIDEEIPSLLSEQSLNDCCCVC